MNLNRVTVAGRLTRDPEVRYTTSGTAVAEISLAVSRFYKDQAGQTKEETDFIDLTAFGRSLRSCKSISTKVTHSLWKVGSIWTNGMTNKLELSVRSSR